MVRTLGISILAIVASLLALMNLQLTSGYTGRVPQGSDAMGLVVPLYGSIVAALCLLVATWLAVAGGRLAWVDPRPTVATVIALSVALGLGAMLVCAFLAWEGKFGAWVAPVGIVGAGIAPLAMTAVLLMSRAADSGQSIAAPVPRGVAGLLAPVAVTGLALGAYMLLMAARASAERASSNAATEAAFEEKWSAVRNRTPTEAAREDMAAIDSAAPLWTVVGGLPETTEADARNIIIQRALKVPAFNEDLAQTIVSKYSRYRYGALLFIQHVSPDKRQPEWGRYVAQCIDSTAHDIAANARWFEMDETRNPNPIGLLRALHDVVALYSDQPALHEAMARLKTAISALPASAARDSALKGVSGGGE